MKYTKRQITAILIISPIISYLLMRYYFNFPQMLCVILVLVFEMICMISFYLESRSVKRYNKLKQDLQNNDHHESDDRHEKYLEFASSAGFEPVRHPSIRSELILRYIRPFGSFWIIMGIALLALNFIIVSEIDLMLFLTAVSAAFILYGIILMIPKNVKAFLKEYQNEYSDINESFITGKQLTYKRKYASISDQLYNCGINIGNEYVVLFTAKEVKALKYSEIKKVNQRILNTRFYGNGLYTGESYTYYVDITAYDRSGKADKVFSVQLNEFQARLACETLDDRITPTELSQNEIDVNG